MLATLLSIEEATAERAPSALPEMGASEERNCQKGKLTLVKYLHRTAMACQSRAELVQDSCGNRSVWVCVCCGVVCLFVCLNS